MILLLTRFPEDDTVRRLGDVLRAQGAEPLIVAPTTLEGHSALSIANGDHGGRCLLRIEGRTVDLRDVDAAWLWRSWRPQSLHPRYRDLAQRHHEWAFFENEWLAFYKGFSLALAYNDVFCVNPPPFNSAFEEKCCQLFVAAEAGLRIPPTLYTARPAVARELYDEHDGQIIYKPFRAYIRVIEGEGEQPARAQRLLTNRVRAADLVEGPDMLPTPGIFQPYIPKQLELRIVVVGKQLFACAIHSQRSERSRDDWRRYDFDNTPYEPYDLPPEIAAKLLQVMERLHLDFGSVDMIVTPEGEYVFLEVNPNGQFDWIARLTGLPIYEHLAAMLAAGRVDYPVDAIQEVPYAG